MADRQDPPTFGSLLKRLRTRSRLTQEALAERAGLSARGLQDLERDVHHPLPETVQRLSRALRLDERDQVEFELNAASVSRRSSLTWSKDATSEPASGLPASLTSFVGRERQLAQVKALLVAKRLVTLVGPPGTGKTRLAIQAASEVAERFADGVCFVSLAPIADSNLVVSTIAHTCGMGDAGRQSELEGLGEHLRRRHVLLVLDNFEHVVDAAPQVATLLASCPTLTVLATSRQPLRVSGEHEVAVPPLDVPAAGRRLAYHELIELESVRLFADRASAVRTDFELTEDNAPVVAELCLRLDGLPLAIELAAARMKLLSARHLLQRLEPRLPFLSGGLRDAPARHRTVRDAIAWSYGLLDDDERTLFRRLSVFAGGCTLAAAEDIGGFGGSSFDLMASLADKSLIQIEEVDGASRVRVLETIREYGLERLEEHGDDDATRRRHAAHYLALVEATPRNPAGFDLLEREHDNLRAALDWYVRDADVEHALRFGGVIWGFWAIRGYVTEGRRRLSSVLGLADSSAPSIPYACVVYGAARLAFNQGDFAAARSLHERHLAIRRAIGDPHEISLALYALGHVAREQGDVPRARTLLEEGLAVAQGASDSDRAFEALGYLGLLAIQEGDYDAARERLETCLTLDPDVRSHGHTVCRVRLGIVAHAQGRREEARSIYESTLAAMRPWGDTRGIANVLISLALVDVDDGELGAARHCLDQAAALLRQTSDRAGPTMLLDALAGLAAAEGRFERALILAAAADAARERLGMLHPRNLRDWRHPYLEGAAQALDAGQSGAARSAGRAMTLDDAINEARDEPGR